MIGPLAGFNFLEAERGVGAQTVTGPDTYLGIESEGDVTGTELRGGSDPLAVGTLTNNDNETLEVQYVRVASIVDGTVDDTIQAVTSQISETRSEPTARLPSPSSAPTIKASANKRSPS